jgi:hypothetical protein
LEADSWQRIWKTVCAKLWAQDGAMVALMLVSLILFKTRTEGNGALFECPDTNWGHMDGRAIITTE